MVAASIEPGDIGNIVSSIYRSLQPEHPMRGRQFNRDYPQEELDRYAFAALELAHEGRINDSYRLLNAAIRYSRQQEINRCGESADLAKYFGMGVPTAVAGLHIQRRTRGAEPDCRRLLKQAAIEYLLKDHDMPWQKKSKFAKTYSRKGLWQIKLRLRMLGGRRYSGTEVDHGG